MGGWWILTDGIGTQQAKHAILGDGLIVGSAHHAIYTLANVIFHAKLFHGSFDGLNQLWIVGIVHRGESRSETFVVVTTERGFARQTGEIDVVLDDHDVAHFEVLVEATGRIGDYEGLDTDELHDTNRETATSRGVAFVWMESALHAYRGHASERAKHQTALVTNH